MCTIESVYAVVYILDAFLCNETVILRNDESKKYLGILQRSMLNGKHRRDKKL